MATGLVWHELYMWHDTGNYAGIMPYGNPVQPGQHAENPETKRRFKNLLEVSGLMEELTLIAPRKATQQEILRAHTSDYIARLEKDARGRGGDAGMFTPFGTGSFEIAQLSAGGVLAATDAVLDGDVRNAYALVRPPGHHALPDLGMGFCLLANAAIAGLHALEARGLSKIAFVDWDVHHGNGTEAIFWSNPRALTISVHQDRSFPPDTGGLEQNGGSGAEGCNINIPLPAGSGVGAYISAFERVVIPALERFEPDLIFVPSGFDAGGHDPLGRMMMHSDGYRRLTQLLMDAADKLCDGRIVMSHEGGYNAPTVPFFGLAVMEELSGIRTGVEDPFMPILGGLGGQELQPHQAAVIDQAMTLLERIP